MKAFLTLLRHDIRLQARHKGEWAALLLFFAVVIVLMPFALGPEPDMLRRLAPGLIWLAALLMALLALDRLFVQDAQDGTLDLLLTAPLPLEITVAAKMLGQILALLAVAVGMSLPAALLLGMDLKVIPVLILSLFLGLPALVLLGGIMSALTVALNRNAALLTLLLIPFYIPVLIFAVAACDAAAQSASPAQPLLLLAALPALVLPASPLIIAALLRQGQA